MKSVKPPGFLGDVYGDLRDKRLLLPAIALIVGLIAVPFLLKSSAPPPAPAPAPVTDTGASELTPAVLADNTVHVRNYRKRLEALKSKNPFKPQFTPPPSETAAQAAAQTGPDTTGTTPTGGTETEVSLTADANLADGEQTDISETVTEDVPTDDGTTDDGATGDDGGGGNGGNEPTADDVDVVEQLFTYRVDLTFGPVGDPKLRENVKPMTILPDSANPVLAYLGTDEKGKRAAFVLSKDATVIAGDAACVPSPESCLYLALEKNETATLAYGPDQQTFNLRLLGIENHELSG